MENMEMHKSTFMHSIHYTRFVVELIKRKKTCESTL